MHCYHCDCKVTEIDYCSGCDEYICDACDETEIMGNHDPEDHQEETDPEEKADFENKMDDIAEMKQDFGEDND